MLLTIVNKKFQQLPLVLLYEFHQASCQFQISTSLKQYYQANHIELNMNLEQLFKNKRNNERFKCQQIDIEQNSSSIIYRYCENKNNVRKQQENQTAHNQHSELSRHKISPQSKSQVKNTNHFEKFRNNKNVLYEFQEFIIYNHILGEGSFSKVYMGQNKKSKKLVAIKQVTKLQENQIACLMNSQSPYIIKLYSFWNVNNHSYIALQLCDDNLRQVLDKISFEEKLQFFQQIVEGMNYLNKKKIIHRDLKFQNILLKNNTVKISDFGFAKPIGSQLAVFSERCGTPYTMAPQIFFHNGIGKPVYSHKCDIYSLGVILHEMIYLKHPFDYCSERMKKNQRVNINKKFGYLDILIQRALQQEVARRCNWNEFMQIFTLWKIKRNQQNVQINRFNFSNLAQKAVQNKENKLREQKNPQKRTDRFNLLKYKKKKFQTPQKKQKKNIHQTIIQNPFNKIDIKHKQRQIFGNSNQIQYQNKRNDQYPSLKYSQRTNKYQDYKQEHGLPSLADQRKQNSVHDDAISVVKLVVIVLMVLLLVTITQKELL